MSALIIHLNPVPAILRRTWFHYPSSPNLIAALNRACFDLGRADPFLTLHELVRVAGANNPEGLLLLSHKQAQNVLVYALAENSIRTAHAGTATS